MSFIEKIIHSMDIVAVKRREIRFALNSRLNIINTEVLKMNSLEKNRLRSYHLSMNLSVRLYSFKSYAHISWQFMYSFSTISLIPKELEILLLSQYFIPYVNHVNESKKIEKLFFLYSHVSPMHLYFKILMSLSLISMFFVVCCIQHK